MMPRSSCENRSRPSVHTLFEAIALVVLVVILFLQTWRASIIPLIAVPVSVVGTFAVLYLLGFSINTLSLFGLVLAIGIVVDDAIVVVENVERNIEEGRTPLAAAHQAMTEVSGPIVAIALVLCAVFVPMAFLSGVTGTFYKQFAVTIAISTVISAINSLTLSPALAAKLLHAHGAPKDILSRLIERQLGWFFRPFNRFFKASSDSYQGAVSRTLRRRGVVFIVYLVLLAGTGLMFNAVPRGFIPTQDKLYLIAGVKLPEGSSLERTDAVLQRMKDPRSAQTVSPT
jgi:Cation/multidrug efflux pump